MNTTIYPLSKIPGDYSLIATDSVDVEGFVTGAHLNPANNEVILSGYTFVSPFAVKLTDFENAIFSSGIVEIIDLQAPSGYSYQIEGVTLIETDFYYFTSESSFAGDAGLFKLELNTTGQGEIFREEFKLYPNPTNGPLTIYGEGIAQMMIYNSAGKFVLESTKQDVDVSHLACGMYFIELRNAGREVIGKEKLFVR